MDARIKLTSLIVIASCLGADYSTRNFVVSAPDRHLAKQVAEAAETYRHDLAIQWLGHELPAWSEKCPVAVRIAPQAGGQTSFGFVHNGQGSVPIGWKMEIFGSPERILDSVLPHEVTHTVFATHFGCPLPRWADEGACTTVEHESERNKNHELLIRFLKSNRGIPFNRMFALKQYPDDIYPLYAQGYSLARFLILQGGPRHFVKYVGAGMAMEQPGIEPRAWDKATQQFYGYADLSELQVRWVSWVKQGCPSTIKSPAAEIARAPEPATQPNAIAQITERESALFTNSTPPVAIADNWYVALSTGSAKEAHGTVAMQLGSAVAHDSSGYRPGSLRGSQSLEALDQNAADSVNTSRIQPQSIYISRPEIELRASPGTKLR